MIEDSEKLKNVLNCLKTSANAFSIKLKYRSPGTIYHVLRGVNNLSEAMIEKIIFHYPQVNYNYLKKGEGEILLPEEEQRNQRNIFNFLDAEEKIEEIPDDLILILIHKLDSMIHYQKKTSQILEQLLNKKGELN